MGDQERIELREERVKEIKEENDIGLLRGMVKVERKRLAKCREDRNSMESEIKGYIGEIKGLEKFDEQVKEIKDILEKYPDIESSYADKPIVVIGRIKRIIE